MRIPDAITAVKDFHVKTSAPVGQAPQLLAGDRRQARLLAEQLRTIIAKTRSENATEDNLLMARAAMALEELAEWLTAHAAEDLVAAADAWADRVYILFGDAVAAGLPAAELFTEIHRSNMTKEPATDGGGKAIKGENYSPPQLEAILAGAKR